MGSGGDGSDEVLTENLEEMVYQFDSLSPLHKILCVLNNPTKYSCICVIDRDILDEAALQLEQLTRRGQTTKKQAAIRGKAGGHARAAKLTARQRSNIARKAANTRWRGESHD